MRRERKRKEEMRLLAKEKKEEKEQREKKKQSEKVEEARKIRKTLLRDNLPEEEKIKSRKLQIFAKKYRLGGGNIVYCLRGPNRKARKFLTI